MSTNETTSVTEAVEAEEKAKTPAGQVLKEVQAEGNGKPKGKGKGKTPKAVKKVEAQAAEPKPTLNWLKLPEPAEKAVELKKIELDRRLQHRKDLQDTREGGAVDQYADVARDAKAAGTPWPFPAVELIEDADGTFWLWDGFQRVGAARLAGFKEIPANIRKGTFADALMLSLGANGENSVIPRTKGDAQRAIESLLDTPSVLEIALKNAKGQGGIHRFFASLCKTSTGTVDWALKARGLKPKGNELVKYTPKPNKEDDKREPTPQGALSGITGERQTAEVTPAQQRKIDNEAFQQMRELPNERLIGEAVKCAKRIGAIFAAYLMDDEHGTEAGRIAEKFGFPVSAGFHKEAAKEGKNFQPYLAVLEHCEAIGNIVEGFSELGKAIADAEAKEQAAAEKEAEKEAAK